MKIDVRDAALKTATVEVKTLTISGRQMTLGVFRQLERRKLLDEKSEKYNGMAWGRVNYFWDGCDGSDKKYPEPDSGSCDGAAQNEYPHPHIVWQDGQDLRRACVSPPNTQYIEDDIEVVAKAALASEDDDKKRRLSNIIDAKWARMTNEEKAPYYKQAKDFQAWQRAENAPKLQRWAELEALPQLFIAV